MCVCVCVSVFVCVGGAKCCNWFMTHKFEPGLGKTCAVSSGAPLSDASVSKEAMHHRGKHLQAVFSNRLSKGVRTSDEACQVKQSAEQQSKEVVR